MKILVGDRLLDVSDKRESEEAQTPTVPPPPLPRIQAHIWPSRENEPEKGVTLHLKTKLRGTKLFYEFDVVGTKGLPNLQRRYMPVFRDSDNLELLAIPMPTLAAFEYGETNEHGTLTSVTHYGIMECSPDLYEEASSWWVRSQ